MSNQNTSSFLKARTTVHMNTWCKSNSFFSHHVRISRDVKVSLSLILSLGLLRREFIPAVQFSLPKILWFSCPLFRLLGSYHTLFGNSLLIFFAKQFKTRLFIYVADGAPPKMYGWRWSAGSRVTDIVRTSCRNIQRYNPEWDRSSSTG